MPLVSFVPPENIRKTLVFCCFQGGIENRLVAWNGLTHFKSMFPFIYPVKSLENLSEMGLNWACRKQPPDVFYKKVVLKNIAKSTGKHLCRRLFLKKVAGLSNRETLTRWFPVNFAKFLRTLFLQNTFGQLLLVCLPEGFCYRITCLYRSLSLQRDSDTGKKTSGFCKIFEIIFFIEHRRWLLLSLAECLSSNLNSYKMLLQKTLSKSQIKITIIATR